MVKKNISNKINLKKKEKKNTKKRIFCRLSSSYEKHGSTADNNPAEWGRSTWWHWGILRNSRSQCNAVYWINSSKKMHETGSSFNQDVFSIRTPKRYRLMVSLIDRNNFF